MNPKLLAEVQRRKDQQVEFYRGAIGNKLKKRRLEMRMTQETLAKGIISNTFVSKLENNVIHASRECMLLLMEKLDLPAGVVDLPEDLLCFLERSLECFYWQDWDKYERLMEEVRSFDFAVLIEIVRLGYHVMTRNVTEALRIHRDLGRYYPSMDGKAFTVLMIYGAGAAILAGNHAEARECLEAAEFIMPADDRLAALVLYEQSVLEGKLFRWSAAEAAAAEARRLFEARGNLGRLMLMTVDRCHFRLGEALDQAFRTTEDAETPPFHFFLINSQVVMENEIPYRPQHTALLSSYDADRYHLILSLRADRPEDFLDLIPADSEAYPLAVFVRCQFLLMQGRREEYRTWHGRLETVQDEREIPLDFHRLLELKEKGNEMSLKDFLIENVLPLASRKNDILLLKLATRDVVRVLISKKRYKDACAYTERMNREIQRMREMKRLKSEPTSVEMDQASS